MDINDLRIAVTVISLLLFIALVAHTWSRRRNAEYASAALLPFVEDGALDGGAHPNENRGEMP
jgi:cytochrome c oxidase cbb3-type subunit 4